MVTTWAHTEVLDQQWADLLTHRKIKPDAAGATLAGEDVDVSHPALVVGQQLEATGAWIPGAGIECEIPDRVPEKAAPYPGRNHRLGLAGIRECGRVIHEADDRPATPLSLQNRPSLEGAA